MLASRVPISIAPSRDHTTLWRSCMAKFSRARATRKTTREKEREREGRYIRVEQRGCNELGDRERILDRGRNIATHETREISKVALVRERKVARVPLLLFLRGTTIVKSGIPVTKCYANCAHMMAAIMRGPTIIAGSVRRLRGRVLVTPV